MAKFPSDAEPDEGRVGRDSAIAQGNRGRLKEKALKCLSKLPKTKKLMTVMTLDSKIEQKNHVVANAYYRNGLLGRRRLQEQC